MLCSKYSVLVGKLRERDHWENLGIGGRLILNGSSRSRMGGEAGLIWLRIGIRDRLM
jgi:hypothetical protein